MLLNGVLLGEVLLGEVLLGEALLGEALLGGALPGRKVRARSVGLRSRAGHAPTWLRAPAFPLQGEGPACFVGMCCRVLRLVKGPFALRP